MKVYSPRKRTVHRELATPSEYTKQNAYKARKSGTDNRHDECVEAETID